MVWARDTDGSLPENANVLMCKPKHKSMERDLVLVGLKSLGRINAVQTDVLTCQFAETYTDSTSTLLPLQQNTYCRNQSYFSFKTVC